MTLADQIEMDEQSLRDYGPVQATAPGANNMKFPITAFDNLMSALEAIEEQFPDELVEDAEVEFREQEDEFCRIHVGWESSDRREVADALWDSWYFMGDAPRRFNLRVTWNEFQQFHMSND